VRVECVLLRPRIRVAVLLGQPDLSQVLLLALAAATRPAQGVLQLLDRIGDLLGLALVRCIGVGIVVRRLSGRARIALARLLAGDRRRSIRVQGVLLRPRIGVGVLLGQRELEHVLLLPVATTAGPAAGAPTNLRGSRVLLGLAVVARIRNGVVVCRLRRRARAADHATPGDADRDVGVQGVLLGDRIRIRVLLRQRKLGHVLLLAVTATAGPAAGLAELLGGVGGLVGLADVGCVGVCV